MTDDVKKTVCSFCGRAINPTLVCRNTRDMDDFGDAKCKSTLLQRGGGERTVNRMLANTMKKG
jgi:ribosomal protein L24E